jgi:hypothetical protein
MMAAGTYLLCFAEQPIGNPANRRAMASHYLGWGADLAHRIGQQEAGNRPAAAICRELRRRGIQFQVAMTWPNTDRTFERRLKNRKDAPRWCPLCRQRRTGGAA